MSPELSIIAGSASTLIFAASVLPMALKALRTGDLSSYSLGHLVLANVGNAVHSLYIYHLPVGPIWALHTFYLLSSGLMLALYLSHRGPAHTESTDHVHTDQSTTHHDPAAVSDEPAPLGAAL